MFERFSQSARQAVVLAQTEAKELGHPSLGTEHLLLGLLHQPEDPSVDVLVSSGLDLPTARAAVLRLPGSGSPGVDAEALGAIGIDLTAVRETVEAAFGVGALDGPAEDRAGRGSRVRGRPRVTKRAKKALELSLRETLALKSRVIEPGHLLLGLLREGEGSAVRVIRDHGLDPGALRTAVLATLG